MSDLFWLTDKQIERLRPFFPKSHGKPRVDDRRALSRIVFVNNDLLPENHVIGKLEPVMDLEACLIHPLLDEHLPQAVSV